MEVLKYKLKFKNYRHDDTSFSLALTSVLLGTLNYNEKQFIGMLKSFLPYLTASCINGPKSSWGKYNFN